MESTSPHSRSTGTQHENAKAGKSGKAPADTAQSKKDQQEKSKHPQSENELESSQDKNPVPPDSTRE